MRLNSLSHDDKAFWCRIAARAATVDGISSGIIFSFRDALALVDKTMSCKAAVVFEASSDAILVLDADG